MGKTSVIWLEDKLIRKDKCFECGLDGDLHYHHVIPETLGGTKTIPLCLICHGKVHNKKFVNHKELQRIGIERAKKEGRFLGRAKGTKEDAAKFLSKPKNKEIIDLVFKRYSYSEILKVSDCSASTITKVVRTYENHHKLLLPKSLRKKGDILDISIPDWMKNM
jgi:hypothetical protein